MATIDLVSNLLPGILSAEGRRRQEATQALTSQAQPTTSDSLLAGLMAPMPQTQTEQMRTNIGGLFGLDTRPPMVKLQEQLAGMPLTTAADYANAAQVAKDLGLPAQAVQLSQKSAQLGETEEKARVATESAIAGRAAEAQRVIAAMENTTDPRIMKELQGLIPSVSAGLLSGSELTTAIEKSIDRYSIEPLTAAERESIGRLVDEDPELQSLMQKPGFFARLFGAENDARGREELIREFGRIQQMNPGISDSQIIDMFLAENQSAIEMVVQGEGTDAPTETVSGEPSFVPAGETPEGNPLMTGAEQRAFLDKVGNDKAAQVTEINRLVVKRLDEEDAAGRRPRNERERSRRAAQLRREYARTLGLDVTPPTIATPGGPF